MNKEYLIDALRYKSDRRLNLVRLFQSIGKANNCEQLPENEVLDIIECVHSSASIIDDMLDNESIRKGVPSYYKRNGFAVASFASLNLMILGVEKISKYFPQPQLFLQHIRNMINAEEADLNLSNRESNKDYFEWYNNTVSIKISEELILILRLCFEGNFKTEKSKLIYETIYNFGKQIQYCNDWYDILVRDPFLRVEDDNYVFTYSLPFALHLQEYPQNENLIGKYTQKQDAKLIFEKVRTEKILNEVLAIINENHNKILTQININQISELYPLIEFLDKIKSNLYWENN